MPDLNEEQWAEVETQLYAGRKIEAIKVFREATGASLKESKDVLDEHEDALREQFPERFKVSAKSGCGAAALIGMVASGAAWVYMLA